jgi:hypothetical protein
MSMSSVPCSSSIRLEDSFGIVLVDILPRISYHRVDDLPQLWLASLALLYYIYGGGSLTPAGQQPLVQLNAGNFSTSRRGSRSGCCPSVCGKDRRQHYSARHGNVAAVRHTEN